MTTDLFKTLLEDLYDVYNPSGKENIPNLIQKYVGQEFDCIRHLILRYNFPKSPFYNPEIGTPDYIKKLINDYTAGNRTLSKEKIAAPPPPDRHAELASASQKTIEISEQTKLDIEKKQQDFLDFYTEKLNAFDRYVVNGINIVEKKISEFKSSLKEQGVEVKLNMLYTETAVELPSDVADLRVNDRFIIRDSNKQIIALQIVDVCYDYISFDGKIIKDITIDKA